MPRGARQLDGPTVAEPLGAAIPGAVTATTDEWVEVAPDRIVDVLRWLHDSPEFDAKQLACLTAVDRYDRFEVVYFLQSLDRNLLIQLKVILDEHENASLPSCYSVYRGALFQEREVYDLMGIRFEGHPDLRRLLLWEGYPGHPLRKDFLQVEGHHPGLPKFPFEEPGVQVR